MIVISCNSYLFFSAFMFGCFDSPLPSYSKEVKSMLIIMFLVATYFFNILVFLKILMLTIE